MSAEQGRLAYDLHATFEENARRGPLLGTDCPKVPETPLKRFLGLPVSSRFGIAAGLLPNSRWIGPYARLGFDLLTYKTVRSVPRASHPMPNWVFVEDTKPPTGPVTVLDTLPGAWTDASSSVCFGMPSAHPDHWRGDVATSRQMLGPGQALIVSVVASPEPGWTLEKTAEDFAQCAAWAVEAGAQVVEANLSCPNVCTAEGTLYLDPQASGLVARRVREAIGATPLLLKVGKFEQEEILPRFLDSVADSVNGLTLLNCISREVLLADGRPAFGEGFRMAGVLGRAIHRPAVEAVRRMKESILLQGLDLAVAGVGGVASVADAADFFDAGADAVLCGSSPAWLPDLAIQIKEARPDW